MVADFLSTGAILNRNRQFPIEHINLSLQQIYIDPDVAKRGFLSTVNGAA